MPDKRPQRVPVITVLVNIIHTALQAGLQLIRIIAKQEHNRTPRQRRKRRPGIVVDLGPQRLVGDDGEARVGPDGEVGERQRHARKDVNDDLLAYGRDLAGARGADSKDKVAAYHACEEGVVWTWGGLVVLAARTPRGYLHGMRPWSGRKRYPLCRAWDHSI